MGNFCSKYTKTAHILKSTYTIDENDIEQFKIIRENEIELLNMLVIIDEIDEVDGELVYIKKTLEPETVNDRNILLSKMRETYNLLYGAFFNVSTFTTRISCDNHNNYLDVFELDSSFLNPSERHIKGKVKSELIILKDCYNLYEGMVWTFTRDDFPDFQGMYAIRSSLLNFLSKNKRGVGSRLIDKVIELAKKNGKTSIIVPWPLQSMIPILHKKGFTEVNCYDKSNEKIFLEPVALTSNYFVYKLV